MKNPLSTAGSADILLEPAALDSLMIVILVLLAIIGIVIATIGILVLVLTCLISCFLYMCCKKKNQ